MVESGLKIPLIVVGTEVEERKFLIAFDGSDNSKKAVDCVADFAKKDDCHILLLNVIRSLNTVALEKEVFLNQGNEKSWSDDKTKKVSQAQAKVLLEYGERLIRGEAEQESSDGEKA